MAITWKDYLEKSKPADTDELMALDTTASANKRIKFSGVWDWIVDKLATAVMSKLETQNKTLIGAINELNSNWSSSREKGKVSSGETREIIFNRSYGCIIFFYHPYFGTALYSIVPYENEQIKRVDTIKDNNNLTLKLSKQVLTVTAMSDFEYFIFKTPFQ